MRPILFLTVLLCPAIGAYAQDDYAALLDEAVAAIDWDFGSNWAFTETTLQDDKLWVARHDPRNAEHGGWTLISVDGRKPTARELRNFLQDKEDESNGLSDDNNRVVNIVDADSVQLVAETDSDWVFAFTPRNEEMSLLDGIEARLKIAKQGPHVELVELRMDGESKPGFGTTVTRMALRFEFGPAIDGGPIVPQDMKVHIAGRALWFFAFEETEAIEYSDFEYAGD